MIDNTFMTVLVPTIILIMVVVAGVIIYCDKNPSIFLEDVCYNADFRCEWECDGHGKNYTGYRNGTLCDCGEFYVSCCTGFKTEK